MTFEAFTSKLVKIVPIVFLLLVAASLRLYPISGAFSFDHDQVVPAKAAYDFFVNHKITLIGQELSYQGLFLGPVHNWLQFIPYGLCRLSSACVPYFYTAIGILTVIIHYRVVKSIFDRKTAFVTALIYAASFLAISYEWGVNSNFFLFLTSSLLLYCFSKFINGDNSFLIIAGFLAGLATVNFNPVFIFSVIAFVISVLLTKKRKLVIRRKTLFIYALAIFVFIINYLPLVIFNFRHQNILLTSLKNFASDGLSQINYGQKLWYLIKDVQLPFFSTYIFYSASILAIFILLVLLVIAFIKLAKLKSPLLVFLMLWIILPLLGFLPYKGWISDYYFQQSLVPLTVVVAYSASRNIFLFVLFVSIVLFGNFGKITKYQIPINYQIKKQAVDHIIKQSAGSPFNVYYDLPPGFNTGYDYLFRIVGKEPQEGDHNIFIIKLVDSDETENNQYFMAFPDRRISFKNFGGVQVILAEKNYK